MKVRVCKSLQLEEKLDAALIALENTRRCLGETRIELNDAEMKLERVEAERDAAVKCLEEISLMHRVYSQNWIDDTIDKWRGAQEDV